ncbi:hypothetical protein GGP41_004329 [Bipolaris sorokiniana]|uniref:Uncharacterized protein n=1 Tax=Cochliobolus sativus TaxID=45130 RepID=A0A8H6DXH7_COCSA|nr:hypothetical protein GGP41_004329 [Bipolaris sorokiniana]
MAWTIDVFFEAICFYFGVLRAEEEEHGLALSAPFDGCGNGHTRSLSGPVNCIPTSREYETRYGKQNDCTGRRTTVASVGCKASRD